MPWNDIIISVTPLLIVCGALSFGVLGFATLIKYLRR